MIFFLDTANIDEIREANSWGVIAGGDHEPVAYRPGRPGL